MLNAGLEPISLEHAFADALPELCVAWAAHEPAAPTVIVLNSALSTELGIDPQAWEGTSGTAALCGATRLNGSMPVAQAYAGHQFANFSPRLGDGRALLLGELRTPSGTTVDLHLKGSGRTPFARGGDGKAAIGPMLREYVISEALAALGIPTTRALAVVATGEFVAREQPLPGAVLTRVAASHLRVGSVQYAAALGDPGVLQRLCDFAIARHIPTAANEEHPHMALYEHVVSRQAALLAQWMLAGFIHGVMNTDNMTLSGESIDFGPCAFMDTYDPATVFSSIDHQGRYAYGNQPGIAQWNLARLAEAMLPLFDADTDRAVELATAALSTFATLYNEHWSAGMHQKLGLSRHDVASSSLIDEYLAILQRTRLDYTATFRTLADGLRGDNADLIPFELQPWFAQWRSVVAAGSDPLAVVAARMDAVNPAYIPRNHLVEAALDAATEGDLSVLTELVDVVRSPFVAVPGRERFAEPAPASDVPYRTFCGT